MIGSTWARAGRPSRIIDLETGEYRASTLKDLYLLARL